MGSTLVVNVNFHFKAKCFRGEKVAAYPTELHRFGFKIYNSGTAYTYSRNIFSRNQNGPSLQNVRNPCSAMFKSVMIFFSVRDNEVFGDSETPH